MKHCIDFHIRQRKILNNSVYVNERKAERFMKRRKVRVPNRKNNKQILERQVYQGVPQL